jgi:hypothetical protein
MTSYHNIVLYFRLSREQLTHNAQLIVVVIIRKMAMYHNNNLYIYSRIVISLKETKSKFARCGSVALCGLVDVQLLLHILFFCCRFGWFSVVSRNSIVVALLYILL